MNSRTSRALPALLLAATWASAAPAQAHGGPPRTRAVTFQPGAPDRILLQTSYGLVRSTDGGDTWQWTCPQAASWGFGGNPPFVVAESGLIFAAVFAGLSRGDATACVWDQPVATLRSRAVSDVRIDPAAPRRLLAIESSGGGGNRIWETTDGGDTWAPTAQPPRDVLYETVRFAPSDPSRAYLSGGTAPTEDQPRTGVVYRSDDGGRTFPRSSAIEIGESGRLVLALAVSPTDPDVVFVRVTSVDEDDALLRSVDGGETWSTVLRMPTLRGFAIAPDGETMWATGLEGGLRRSTDGGDTFEVLDAALDGHCLVHDGEALWMCGEVRVTGFALARSADGGDTFETVYADEDVAPAECDPESSAALECAQWLGDFCFDLELDEPYCPPAPVPPQDAGVRPGDAGAPGDAASGGGSGGGCRAAGAGPTPGAGLIATALAAGALSRRRRRGAPRRR